MPETPRHLIRMLGSLEVQQGEQKTTHFPTRKVGALLAYLALFPHRDHPRETLTELFWPEHTPDRARNNLSIALSFLRSLFEPPGTPAGTLLRTDRHHIRLNADALQTDAAAFETLTRAPDTKTPENFARLEQGLELYRGELLPGFYDDWVLQERERLAEIYIQAARQAVRYCVQQKELTPAIGYARRIIAADPLREEAHHDLMRLFVATNQFSAAQQQYRELEQTLERELGVRPSGTVQQLFREIESKIKAVPEPKAAPASPPITPSAPEPLKTEAAPPKAETVALPTVIAETTAASLPAFTRFIGRETVLEQVKARLREPETRLLTITGLGGGGKTRLAAEVSRQMTADFSGAVWFVPLADVPDASHIAATIAAVVSPHTPPQEEPVAAVLTALPETPCLLVLDNYEHLITDGAALTANLLARAPQLKVLVTSRQLLGLTMENEFPLRPMATPGRLRTLEPVLACESVRLFADRARAARPDFQIKESNVAAVAELCNRLDGLPLALELAAARTAILSPAQMLEQLQKRFALLVSRKRDVPERHRTLRATLEWSCQLLPPEVQAFFAQLSIFRGGWTVEAAEAVCDDELAMDALAQLQECSLLYSEEQGDRIRFRMLETVQAFAALHLPETEAETLRQRHFAHYAEWAESLLKRANDADAGPSYLPLESELENLRAALDWIFRQDGAAETAFALANALHPFWKLRGHYREGRQWLARAEDSALPLTPATRALALHGAGSLALLQADYAEAERLLNGSLRLWQEMADAEGTANTLSNLGVVTARLGRTDEARRLFAEGLALRRERADWPGVADTLVWLGTLAHREGDLPEAQRLLMEALELYQKYGTPAQCAVVLNNLGVLAHELARPDTAQHLYRQSLELHRQSGNRSEMAWNLNNLGNVLREMGKAAEAVACAEESVLLWRELGNAPTLALALNTLGMAHSANGNPDVASACFAESWAFSFRQNDREGMAYTLAGLAEVALAQGEPERAVRLLARAQKERETLPLAPPPSDLRDWNHTLTKVRAALPPATFEAEWQIGGVLRLSLEPPAGY